jgi:hypothetical protein
LAGRLKEKKYVTITADSSLYAALYVGYNGTRVTLGTGKLTMDTAANCPLRENAYRNFRGFLIWLREWDLPTMWIFQTQEILHFLHILAYGFQSRNTDRSHYVTLRNSLQFSSVLICLADKDTIMIHLL